MKKPLQFAGVISSVGAAAMLVWLQTLPSLVIGSYWQTRAMAVFVVVSTAAQLAAFFVKD